MNSNQLQDLAIGDKLTKNAIKQLKDNLQVYHGSKLSLTSNKNINKIFIKCKEIPCPFEMVFVYDELNLDQQNIYYVYIENKEKHTCDPDELMKKFYERRKYLISLTSMIREIMAENMIKERKSYTPLELLSELAFRINEPEDFLYEGLTDYHMKRKLKKKFDNIVNDLKKATEEEIRNYKEINGEIENSYEDDEISKPQEEDDKIEISESKTEKMIQRNNRSKSIFHEDKEESCSREKFGDSSFPLAQSENIFSSENRNKPMSFESDFGENDLFPNIDHNFGDDD